MGKRTNRKNIPDVFRIDIIASGHIYWAYGKRTTILQLDQVTKVLQIIEITCLTVLAQEGCSLLPWGNFKWSDMDWLYNTLTNGRKQHPLVVSKNIATQP